ncbi:MAG: Transcriptional regulator, AbiEi antitoxin [Thermoleophilaceae bacterium]|jgi:hypothetical protein|nr:Transcriptional regulator, AbiEi antitoxin [Thermoleophilaceae bacterium]
MSRERVQASSSALWALARRQHGVVTRRQLLRHGFSPDAIDRRIARGRLHAVWRGVYAVGRPDLRYHRTPAQQARDRLRDQTHAAAGLMPVRFTHAQVAYEPEHVRSILAAVVGHLEARGRTP